MKQLIRTRKVSWLLVVSVALIAGFIGIVSSVHAAGLAVDTQVAQHQGKAGSITSPTFSTSQPGELIVAFISSDGPKTANGQSVTTVTGGSLTWTLRQRTNSQYGTSEIWQAFAPSQLTNASVQATLNSAAAASLTVTSFTGADTTTNGAVGTASAATGAPTVNLTTTRAGSWVWGAGDDWDAATSRMVGANQTKADEYLATTGDTFWVQRQTATTPSAGTTVTLNDTAPTADRWNFSAIEILPANGGTTSNPPTVSLTAPAAGATVSGNTTVTATAADDVAVLGVQFKVDGTNIGTEDTTSPYTAAWTTTSLPNGSHSLTAMARDGDGNATTSTPVTVTVTNAGGTPLTIDGSTTYQTMTGLGAAVNVHSWDNGNLKPALDMLIANGTKTFRIVMEMTDWQPSATADPTTYYDGTTTYDTAQSGSNFSDLWNTIDYLHQKGIPDNQIALAFMGIGPSWMGTLSPGQNGSEKYTLNAGQEDAWAQMIASAAYYGYSHGHTFGMLSPDNELDWSYHEGIDMSASQWAMAMNLLNTKLNSYGTMSSVRFLGPESVSGNPTSYEDALAAYPAVLARLDHFSGHNYTAANPAGPINAAQYGKDFWVSELSDSDFAFGHLTANVSGLLMWEGYDSVYNHAQLNGLGNAPGNDKGPIAAWLAYNTTTKAYTPRKGYYEFGQIFKYVPLGATRISATQSDSGVKVVAFYDNTTHRTTIVGVNDGTSTVSYNGTLSNLGVTPTSLQSYTTNLATTSSVNMQQGSDVAVTGTSFNYNVPANTMFTLTYAPPADAVPPTAPSNLAVQGAIGKAMLSWNASSDNVAVTGYNIYRSTTAGFTPDISNKVGTAPTNMYTDNVTAGSYYYRIIAFDTANNLSPSSNEASGVVTGDTTAPTAPSGLTATAASSSLVNLSWNASSDNVGVTGYQVYRGGTLIGNGNGANTSYADSTVSPNTAYSYTIKALDAASNASTNSNTATATTPLASSVPLSLDTTVSTHQPATANTITSPALSTSGGNELLVAFIESDGNVGQTFSSVTGGGLTWTLRQRSNTQKGTAEIWQAVATSPISNITVMATRGGGNYTGSMTVAAFIGANLTTNGATATANALSGAPTITLTTTRANSWVWGVGNDWDSAVTRTVGPNQTKVDEFLASVGDTYWVQRQTAPAPLSGTVVTINDTAPTNDRWNLAAIEILPTP